MGLFQLAHPYQPHLQGVSPALTFHLMENTGMGHQPNPALLQFPARVTPG